MNARRGRSPRVAALVAAVFVALGLAGLAGVAVADATQLTVASNPLFLQNASRCTNATIATTGFKNSGTGNWDRVRLVGVPDACAGLPIELTVYHTNSGGTTYTQLATGTGDAALGTVVAVATAYDSTQVTGVALLIGGWWVPTTWSPGGISLRSFQTGLYVTAAGTGSSLIASSSGVGTHEQFDLINNVDGSVSLRAHGASNHYVTAADQTSPLIANSTGIGTPQKFNLINNPDGTIALQSLQVVDTLGVGMYVCAENAGASPLIANRTWIREWEEFYLVID